MLLSDGTDVGAAGIAIAAVSALVGRYIGRLESRDKLQHDSDLHDLAAKVTLLAAQNATQAGQIAGLAADHEECKEGHAETTRKLAECQEQHADTDARLKRLESAATPHGT